MTAPDPAIRFVVLNPGGRDPAEDFSTGAGGPDNRGHGPVNYHAYAACLRGRFERDVARVDATHVLVLVRKRGFAHALDAVTRLRQRGVAVFVTFKEAGWHQVSDTLAGASRWDGFCRLCEAVDGWVAPTHELAGVFQAAGGRRGAVICPPYPVDDPAWNFHRPLARRSGIFLGTRDFETPSRSHVAALAIAARLGFPVTTVTFDGRAAARLVNAIAPKARVIFGPLDYTAYLREMASHRIVFQLDRSLVPGQVAGDALLCRMPCVGGDGTVERIAFPALTSLRHSPEALAREADRLMRDDAAWHDAVADAHAIALRDLAFAPTAAKLAAFLTDSSDGASRVAAGAAASAVPPDLPRDPRSA